MRGSMASLLVVAAMLAAGCLGQGQEPLDPREAAREARLPRAPPEVVLSDAVGFLPGVVLTGSIGGFEPSIRAGPEGNLYAAAAKTTRPNADARLADWAWYSNDRGATWHDLPLGPADAGGLMPGLEGDMAVDGEGRVYYMDTYAADNTLHRWSVGADRLPVWDFSRPVVPTIDVLDDRPYMAAHGDGIVYLLSNNGADPPAWQNVLDDPTDLSPDGARIWVFASHDAGLTWSLGWGLPGETFCAPAASRADDATSLMACHRGSGDGATMTVYRSTDRGLRYEAEWVTNYTNGPGYLTPWPAMDEAGWGYAAWLDDRLDWEGLQTSVWAGEEPGRVMFARSADGAAWEQHDVTPFEGRFGMNHVSAWPSGVVAITFHATTDLAPDEETEWYGYALVTADARAAQPEWHLALLDGQPTNVGTQPPRDFFQNAVLPDGGVGVILQRNRDRTADEDRPLSGPSADILGVVQAVGPNLPVAAP